MTTKIEAYQTIKEEGTDISLRKQVALVLAGNEPLTTQEIAKEFPERSLNAIRPRVNELLRMDCIKRDGRKKNPSGHEAYLHHLTDTGIRYLNGEIDPEPDPPIAELQRMVVKAARDYCNDNVDVAILKTVVDRHDRMQARMDPEI